MRHVRDLVATGAIVAVMALVGSVAPAGADGGEGTPPQLFDNFYTPAVIPAYVYNGVENFNNLGATTQVCEPLHAGVSSGSSVWFRLQARNQRTLVRLNTRGSDFDTVLAVYRGSNLCSVQSIAYDDDCPTGIGPSCLQFVAQRGVNYRIAVAGYSGVQGNFRLRLVRSPY